MDKTNIIWTEKTWNPVSGCEQVSAGCAFCYAKTIAENFSKKAFPNGFGLTLRPHKMWEPYTWGKPTLAFVNSMSDLFWDEIPNDYRDQIIDVIEANPQHEFQVLTKRPERMLQYSQSRPLPANLWAGVTIENRRVLHERLDLLRATTANIKFVSFEPLLEDLQHDYSLFGIDWVITGGESGNHLWQTRWQEKRGLVYYDRQEKKFIPYSERIDWIRNIRDKSIEENVAFFHKQWGGSYPEAAGRMLDGRTWNQVPKLPGEKRHIDNQYLKQIDDTYDQEEHIR